jgi:hypothetical protein
MDYAGVMPHCNVKSIHNGIMYGHYKEGTEIKPSKEYEWNLIEMAGLAGLNTVVFENGKQEGLYLHPDGLTNKGQVWFVTNNHEMFICEHYVDRPQRIVSIYQQ